MIPNRYNFKFTHAALLFLLCAMASTAHAKHILIYGDSLSAAYGMDLEQGWVYLLKEKWAGQHQISNASISGETTQGGVQRLSITLERMKPDVVLIELGANDAMRGSPISRIRDNLEQMVELSQQAGAKVAIAGISIPASYGPRYIDQFRAVFTEVAEQSGAAYIDLYDQEFISRDGYIQADGLHPTAITQPIIRDRLAEFLNNELLDH
jgi:acyl-CoA thioesterase-1